MDHIFASEPYRLLIEAVRAHDFPRSAAIIEEQILRSHGLDRLFWLAAQIEYRWRTSRSPREYALYWPQLEAMYRLDPAHPVVQEKVTGLVSQVLLATQRGYPPWVRELLPGARLLMKRGAQYWALRAISHELRRRWWRAFRAYDKAIACYATRPAPEQRAFAGHLVFLHAARSVCGMGCNRLEQVEADVRLSVELLDRFPRQYMDPMPTALAQAEFALHQGQIKEAHAALQQGLARNAETPYARLDPLTQVKVELFAARLARAQGNMVGFQNFARRALAIAQEEDLPLSVAAVTAVLEGAER